MELEYKSFAIEVKAIEDAGTFEGYGATFGNVDSWGDIIEPGAFKKTLATHKKAGTTPKLLWQHRADAPIGVWDSLKEDDKGLFVTGRLLVSEVQKAREAHALLKVRAISGLSIGYWARDYSIDEKTGIRTLRQIDLGEISLVTFPANDKANVTDVKAGSIVTKRDFEAALRDVLGFGAKEAKRIASHGFRERDVPDGSGELSAIINKFKEKYL